MGQCCVALVTVLFRKHTHGIGVWNMYDLEGFYGGVPHECWEIGRERGSLN